MDQKLDTLIESNRQHQKSLSATITITKVDNATNVTAVSTESITKLSKDLSAKIPAINKVAHGIAPRSSSVKDAVEKCRQRMPQPQIKEQQYKQKRSP